MKIGHWPSGFRCRVSGVSSEKARASLKPDTRHLKPMLREGFSTPDNVQKKDLFFNHVTRSGIGGGLMKIAISSSGANLDEQVDPGFGCCRCFIVIDPATENF